jgi:hypothetical protein
VLTTRAGTVYRQLRMGAGATSDDVRRAIGACRRYVSEIDISKCDQCVIARADVEMCTDFCPCSDTTAML